MTTQVRDFAPETATISLAVTFPTYEIDVNGTTFTVVLSTILLGLVFYIPNLFEESPGNARSFSLSRRSIQEDQRELFSQIEEGLTAAGMDGHACVLRFICEMQTHSFSPSSIFGEVFSLVFTPKPGGDTSVLQDYIEAETAGQGYTKSETPAASVCAQRYSSCPVSVFSALKRIHRQHKDHSTPEDRPRTPGG